MLYILGLWVVISIYGIIREEQRMHDKFKKKKAEAGIK